MTSLLTKGLRLNTSRASRAIGPFRNRFDAQALKAHFGEERECRLQDGLVRLGAARTPGPADLLFRFSSIHRGLNDLLLAGLDGAPGFQYETVALSIS